MTTTPNRDHYATEDQYNAAVDQEALGRMLAATDGPCDGCTSTTTRRDPANPYVWECNICAGEF